MLLIHFFNFRITAHKINSKKEKKKKKKKPVMTISPLTTHQHETNNIP